MFARQSEAHMIRSVCNVHTHAHTHVPVHCIYESIRRDCTHNLSSEKLGVALKPCTKLKLLGIGVFLKIRDCD